MGREPNTLKKMKNTHKIYIILVFISFCCFTRTSAQDIKTIFTDAEKQTNIILGEIEQARTAWNSDI